MPGFTVTKQGIRSEVSGSTLLAFDNPATEWRAKVTTPFGQSVSLLSSGLGPDRITANLLNVSVAAEFKSGFTIRLHCKEQPYLTWKDGSVAEDVITPELSWALLSFAKNEPPVLLFFGSDKLVQLKIVGKSGNWRIITKTPFQDWVRFSYPLGDLPLLTNNAATLGDLVVKFMPEMAYMTQPAPAILGVKVTGDSRGVTARWEFSSPPFVPAAALMAPLGGYPMQILNPIKRLPYSTNEGPIAVSLSNSLVFRFPSRSVPPGRPLLEQSENSKNELNQAEMAANSVALPPDSDSGTNQFIGNLAIKLLSSDKTGKDNGVAEDTLTQFLVSEQFHQEVWTGDILPYAADGSGMEAVAAQALLTTAVAAGRDVDNPLLTSVVWSRDWYDWMPLADITPASGVAKATSFTSIAAAMSPDLTNRMDGAMFEAGLAAIRSRNLSNLADANEPLTEYRASIFTAHFPGAEMNDADALYSPLRIYSSQRCWLIKTQGAVEIQWVAEETHDKSLLFSLPLGTKVVSVTGLKDFQTSWDADHFTVEYSLAQPTVCTVRISLPPGIQFQTHLPPFNSTEDQKVASSGLKK